ncbi:hypothetical protein DPMN_108445 [Dreissena polymorpha]|uniref:Uncharacterized protein n=1 Tax=Dreissena polymorpha TaxID=45954 RepID=A0A9D4K8J0_DREPO|nr:hypothetical protein DPMN_108445 [Dreissena polymorpha]
MEKCPAPGDHVFKATKTIFELIQDIIGTNLLTKFHDDRKINVTSRVLTRKNAPPPLWPYIIRMNMTINVAFRVKNAPPIGSNVFQAKTNLLTKFHEDRKINVASREKCPAPGGHVFQPTGIIFILVQDNYGMNLLTKFHEDSTTNVVSKKNAPPIGRHVFQTNLLTKFHEDRKINVASKEKCPAPGGHVFQPTGIIFKLVQDNFGMNLLTKFHEDSTTNVVSKVKNAPPLGRHVFQVNVTIFVLVQDIIESNLLTKFHEDWTKNVASRELTRQMLMAHDGRRTKGVHKSSP